MIRRRSEDDTGERKPDVAGAREQLARVRAQRPDVKALVEALAREKQLNNFTANGTVVFRGGRS